MRPRCVELHRGRKNLFVITSRLTRERRTGLDPVGRTTRRNYIEHAEICRVDMAMQKDERTLHAAIRAVLNTINQMLCAYFWETSLKPKFAHDTGLHRACLGMHNAAVESTLISIRAFDDFCRNERRRDDDLLPEDFPGLIINGSFLDITDRDGINKQVAHLTHVSLQETEHRYQYRTFLAAALPRARQFCQYSESCAASRDEQLVMFVRETLTVIERVNARYVSSAAERILLNEDD